jgi:Protein of unknown function (DUF3108)
MSIRILPVLVIIFHLALAPSLGAAAIAPDIRENLRYQVSLGPWSDVARVHLVLRETAPGHYRAEFSGAAQGMWNLLSRWLPERYTTEMVYREGSLKPLIYREEFMDKGQHWVKEYRFDYEHRRLTLRRQIDGGEWVKKWEAPLTAPVYDLLSLAYNVRIGALGPLRGGSNLRVLVLSSEPRELVFRIGEKTVEGQKVMLNFRPPDSDSEDQYFIELNPRGVPTLAWTRVTFFGRLAGRLLNPGEIRTDLLPALPPVSSTVLEAHP